MSSRCFTYGSLMCADIMAAVCGYAPEVSAAILPGYARRPVRGEDYPAIVADATQQVAGQLYAGISASAWERLDGFEGRQYERRLLQLRLGDGRGIDAWAYVFRPQYRSLLLLGEWNFDAFLREGRQRFEARHLGFQQLQQQ